MDSASSAISVNYRPPCNHIEMEVANNFKRLGPLVMKGMIELERQKALRFSSRIQSTLLSISFLVLAVHGITTTNFLSQLTLPVAFFVGAIVYLSISFLLTMILATPVEYLTRALIRTFWRSQAMETMCGDGKASSP